MGKEIGQRLNLRKRKLLLDSRDLAPQGVFQLFVLQCVEGRSGEGGQKRIGTLRIKFCTPATPENGNGALPGVCGVGFAAAGHIQQVAEVNNACKQRDLLPFFSKRTASIGVFVMVQNGIAHVGMKGQTANVLLTQQTV